MHTTPQRPANEPAPDTVRIMRRKLNRNAVALADYFDLGRRDAIDTELLLTEVHLSPGDMVTRQGGGGNRQILVLLDGTVEVRRDGVAVAHLGAGDVIGELTMLGYAPWSTADVVCVSEVRALAGGLSDVARMRPQSGFLAALRERAQHRPLLS